MVSEARYRVEERLGLRGDLASEARRERADAEADHWVGSLLTVTHYFPDGLARRPQVGEVQELSWEWLRRWTQSPSVLEGKADAGGVVFADTESGIRSIATVRTVSALVLDFDAEVACPPHRGHEMIRWGHVLHTTHSHTTDAPRWRAYVRQSRPTTVAEHRKIWPWVTQQLPLPFDAATKDPSRLWYVPSVRAFGVPYVWYDSDADPIDVGAVLAQVAAYEASVVPVELGEVKHADRYARKAIESERGRVAGARPGDRHNTLWDAAFSLSRLVDIGTCTSELLPVFVQVAGDSRRAEGAACITDAYRARASR